MFHKSKFKKMIRLKQINHIFLQLQTFYACIKTGLPNCFCTSKPKELYLVLLPSHAAVYTALLEKKAKLTIQTFIDLLLISLKSQSKIPRQFAGSINSKPVPAICQMISVSWKCLKNIFSPSPDIRILVREALKETGLSASACRYVTNLKVSKTFAR